MRKLTNKNYEKLPEIRKKKEDAKRAQELLDKKERAQKYKKELEVRLKQSMLKKQIREKEKEKKTHKETKTTETMETVIISKQGSAKEPATIQIVQKNKKTSNTKESYS